MNQLRIINENDYYLRANIFPILYIFPDFIWAFPIILLLFCFHRFPSQYF